MKKSSRRNQFFLTILLTVTMIMPMQILTQPVTSATTYWFNYDFDDWGTGALPKDPGESWGSYYLFYNDKPSDCAIEEDTERGKVLRLNGAHRIYCWTDNTGVNSNDVHNFVYQMDVKFTGFQYYFWFGFNEWNMMKFEPNNQGQMTGTEGFKGRIYKDTWANLAIEVNKDTNTYNVYVNHVKVQDAVPLPEAFNSNRFTLFAEAPLDAPADLPVPTLYMDNFQSYGSTYKDEEAAPAELSNYWFNNDFEDLPVQDFTQLTGNWGLDAPYTWYHTDCGANILQSAIVDATDRPGKILQLTKSGRAGQSESLKVFRWTYDNTAPAHAINNPDLDWFTYELDMKITDLSQNWILGFNDQDFVHVRIENDGLIDHANQDGKIVANTWAHVVIEVNRQTNKYNVYLNDLKVVDNQATPFNLSQTSIDNFEFKSNWNSIGNSSTLYVDNFKAYPHAYQDFAGHNYQMALEIPTEAAVSGKIASPGEVDWYKFTAPSDGSYTIESTSPVDTAATLYQESGVANNTVFAENDNNGTNLNFKIFKYLESGQVYYLAVKSPDVAATGNYSFNITRGEDNVGQPNPVSNLHITDLTSSTVTFAWDPPAGNINGLTYWLSNGVNSYSTRDFSITVPYNSGELSHYRVIANGASGLESAESNRVNVTLVGCDAQAGKEYDIFIERAYTEGTNDQTYKIKFNTDEFDFADAYSPTYKRESLNDAFEGIPGSNFSIIADYGNGEIEFMNPRDLGTNEKKTGLEACFKFKSKIDKSTGFIISQA